MEEEQKIKFRYNILLAPKEEGAVWLYALMINNKNTIIIHGIGHYPFKGWKTPEEVIKLHIKEAMENKQTVIITYTMKDFFSEIGKHRNSRLNNYQTTPTNKTNQTNWTNNNQTN